MLHLRRNCIESKVSGRQGEHGCYGVPSEVADQSEGQCEEEDEGEKLRQVHEPLNAGGKTGQLFVSFVLSQPAQH